VRRFSFGGAADKQFVFSHEATKSTKTRSVSRANECVIDRCSGSRALRGVVVLRDLRVEMLIWRRGGG